MAGLCLARTGLLAPASDPAGFLETLIDAQEIERKRIAGELHDGLGQNLLVIKSGATMALRNLDQPAHPIFRRGLCEVIAEEKDLRLIGQAAAGDEALRSILELQPAIAILDVNMPGMTGLEVAREVMAKQPSIRIILLTMHEEEELLNASIHAGILAYVLAEDNTSKEIAEVLGISVRTVETHRQNISNKLNLSGTRIP
jgi:CheY-like chemotaxis protein